jgi:transmembrane sensor
MKNDNDSKPTVDWETLDAYLAGELEDSDQNRDQIDCIRALLDQIPHAELVLKSQGLFQDELNPGAPSSLVNYRSVSDSWAELRGKIATTSVAEQAIEKEDAVHTHPSSRVAGRYSFRSLPTFKGFKVIAQFAAVAAVVAVAWYAGAGKVRNNLSAYTSVYSTEAGRQASLTLPDGTDVLLNVGSRLEVGGDFLSTNRKVKLVGQAQFKVKHQTNMPFSVETANGTVTVLGTEFVVRDYKWDRQKTVSVWSGRVGFASNVVAAGEQLSFLADSTGVYSMTKTALDTTLKAFTTGILIVDDKRLEDIIPELSAWYGMDIQFGDDGVKDRRISGRFQLGAVSELIEVLSWTFNVRSERSGNQLILYSK